MTKEETWATLVALSAVQGESTETEWKLRKVNLSGADIRGANLADTTLAGSILIKTDLTQSSLSGACIDNATISEWVIKDVTCSHTREAKSAITIVRASGIRKEVHAYANDG